MKKCIIIITIIYISNQDIFCQETSSDYEIRIDTSSLAENGSYYLVPNPFSPQRDEVLYFTIGKSSFVKLYLLDSSMSPVIKFIDHEFGGGSYSLRWNRHPLKHGKYFYYLESEDYKKYNIIYIVSEH